MEDENKEEQKNSGEMGAQPEGGQHQHVHIFGAEVNGGGVAGTEADPGTRGESETKEDWRARKQEWKQQHRAQMRQNREQWKAQRAEWKQTHRHEGSMFWGLIILLVGMLSLLYTLGYVSPVFWHSIIPFWPILLILWGASLVLGRNWFARFIVFIFALAFLIVVILYGLVRANSPLVSSLSPNVVQAVQNAQPPQY